MWNTGSIVFCVSLVFVSFLFLPFSIACLILLSTSGIVLVHELQWNVNLSQLKIWMKSSFECLMDNKSSKPKSCPRVLNSNGVTKSHSPLMTNKFKASPNLTPQSKFVNEPIVSDIFKMSLNDSNRHSTPVSMSRSGNYKYDKPDDKRSSWSNNKFSGDQSMTMQRNVQTVAGPLLVSTRFNSNISSELSANASSAGFSSRLAQRGAEMAGAASAASSAVVTHQSKYAGVGVFPVVQLQSRSPKHHLPARAATPASAKAVRVRIAPPDTSPLCGAMTPTDFSNATEGEDSVRSVLQVLKEISRKRIHSQVDEDGDESVKRPKKDRVDENLSKSIDPAVQNKRGREDSPRSAEEVKRQRRHLNGTTTTTTRSNEIMSSLSSSLAVRPPHLCKETKATKRKAHAVDWSRCSTPVSGKVLKVNTSPNKDQVARPSKYQDEKTANDVADSQRRRQTSVEKKADTRPLADEEEESGAWVGGMVRIEAGQRRLLARASSGLIEDGGRGELDMTSRSPSPSHHTTADGHAHPSSSSAASSSSATRLLKQMADPGQRLKDMLAAINGDDDVSTEEATMSPNVVAILKSAKSTSSTSPSNSATTSILKTSVHSDVHKTVSFALPLSSFSESSQPSTLLSTATAVSTSLNSSIPSAQVVTTVKNVSPFTLPSSASPSATATGFQNGTTPPYSSADAPKAASISSPPVFPSPKQEDKSQITTSLSSASSFSNNPTNAESKIAPKQDSSSLFGLTKDTTSINSTLFGANSLAAVGINSTVEKSSMPLASSVSTTATTQPPSFSFSSTTNEFGAKTVETSAGSLFGVKPSESSTASPFGAKPAASSTASPFGAKPAESSSASSFGAKPSESSTAYPFGAKPAESSTASPFGSKPSESSAASPFGAKPAESLTASLFGAKPAGSATTTPSSGNVVFGVGNAVTTSTTSTSSSMFNIQAKSNQSAPSSGAGVATSKGVTSPPAFGTSSMFVGCYNATSSASTVFGASNSTPSSASTMFGGSTNTLPAGASLFGNTSTGSGSQVFGAASASTASSSTPTTTSTPSLNLFGAKTNSGGDKSVVTTTAPASGSLFSGANTAFGSSSTSTFGTAANSGTSFGAAPSSSVFGGTASKQQQDSGFGTAASTTPSTFGSSASSIFGASSDVPKTNAFASSTSTAPMFGAATSTPSSGTPSFGGTASSSSNAFGQTTSGGGFGGSSTSAPAFGGFSSSSTFGSKPTAPTTTTTAQPLAFSQVSSPMFSFGSQSPATSAQSTSMFNGVAQSPNTTLTNGGFGGGTSEDKTKTSGGFGSAFQSAASSSAAPAFSFGGSASSGAGASGAFAFGAATNNNSSGAAQPTESAASAFTFSKGASVEPSKPFAFGGVSSSSGSTAANQQSPFAFNSNNNAASSSAGFQFNAGSNAATPNAAQPQVPGAFVFGGATTPNSGFGMNPPAFTLGAGGGVGGPGSTAGARFSIGSGSTSARSRSVARAKRTK